MKYTIEKWFGRYFVLSNKNTQVEIIALFLLIILFGINTYANFIMSHNIINFGFIATLIIGNIIYINFFFYSTVIDNFKTKQEAEDYVKCLQGDE